MEVARVLVIVGSGLVAGALVAVLAAWLPTLAPMPADQALRVKQRFDRLMDRVTPPLTILAAILAVVLLFGSDDGVVTTLNAIGLAGLVGVGLTSVGYNMRVNRRMAKWAGDTMDEAEFRHLQRRWAVGHAVRTACALTAFACFTVALAAV